MKTSKITIMAVAAFINQVIGTQSGQAQELYRVDVDAVSISTNATGELVYHTFDNRDIVRQSAGELGLTNLTDLRLVYDRTADAIEVVTGTNDTVVSTPATFSGGTMLTNTNHTRTERLAGVYWKDSTTVNGTLLAGEWTFATGTNHPAAFGLNGQLQFAVPGDGTNAPVIYAGTLRAGEGVGWRFDGDRSGRNETSDRR